MKPVQSEILDALGYAYFEVDLKGSLTAANQPFLDKAETTLEHVVGRHFRRFVNPSQVSTIFHAFHRVFETKQTEHRQEEPYTHTNGTA